MTVVISTRNRGDQIAKAIQSILRSDYSDFALRIVDQSENDLTASAVKPFLDDVRVHYAKGRGQGVSAGRNLAISGAQTELIAVTDDDCEVSSDWLRELRAAFALDPRISVVFGNVLSSPCDSRAGSVMAYVRRQPYLARGISEKHEIEGISANMGIRQSVWRQLGGFDEMLGAGSPFRAAGETDFAVRALLSGYFIYETPKVAVIHYGFRSWEQTRSLLQGYLYGIGAMVAKNFKCGHRWTMGQILAHLAWRWAFQCPVVEFGFRPPRGLRLAAFIRGLRAGALARVDRTAGHFIKSGNRAAISMQKMK